MPSGAVYRALLPLARLAARLFHKSVSVRFQERVPERGPVLFAANHPNMMLDVLLLAVSQPRPLHFLAKATLFENPLLGRLLSAAGVLPVYRRRDDPGKSARNVFTFEACHELLFEGGAIAIFPEGESHERNLVLPLKTGCARIALEAEARRGFELGVRILPVGIAFSNRELFRSDAAVTFGEPVEPRPFFDAYRNQGEQEAVRALTRRIEEALRRVAPHHPDPQDEALVSALGVFFREGGDHLTERLEVDRALLRAIAELRDRHPIAYHRLRRRVLGYARALALSGLKHEELGRTYRTLAVARYLAPRLLLALFGALPFAAGLVTHYLPYKLPAWIARRVATHPVERASAKLFVGLVSFPLFYALETFLVARAASPTAASLFLLALPALGLFSLFYLEALTGFFREVRLFLLRLGDKERLRRLEGWRDELAAELEKRRREYERGRSGREALENLARE